MSIEYKVTIIGAGFSGTLVAANLARLAPYPVTIQLVEKSRRFAKGVAYSTTDENHLLNVPASNMSAFPDIPSHFLDWLKTNGHTAIPHQYYSRKTYGRYLSSILDDAAGHITKINSTAIDLEIDNEIVITKFANGQSLSANLAVLALGNFPPITTNAQRALFQLGSNILHNPWAETHKLENIPPDAKILIIGTGLTMVDFVTLFLKQNHKGKITAISRHGYLPEPHIANKPDYELLLPAEKKLLPLFRFFRREVEKAEKNNIPWQAVFDKLRPHTASLWKALSQSDKRRFLRHLRALWDTRRHRMSVDIWNKINSARKSGRLEIRAGRILHLNPLEKSFEVAIKPRGSKEPIKIEQFDYIINCAAPETDIEESRDSLVQKLLAKDLLRPGELRIGIKTSANGALIGKGDFPSPYLYALGPLRKGELWESTAVPELREQALNLARTILENLEIQQQARQGANI